MFAKRYEGEGVVDGECETIVAIQGGRCRGNMGKHSGNASVELVSKKEGINVDVSGLISIQNDGDWDLDCNSL